MEGWNFVKFECFPCSQENKLFIEEALQNDSKDTYQWNDNTLIYHFDLNQSIRLDHLLLAFKKGYLMLSYGQLLNLMVSLYLKLIGIKKNFTKVNLENIWIQVKQKAPLSFTFKLFDFDIQFVGYEIDNNEDNLAKLNLIIGVIIELVSAFPEDLLVGSEQRNLQILLLKILSKRKEDQIAAKLGLLRNTLYNYPTQKLIEERLQPSHPQANKLRERFLQISGNEPQQVQQKFQFQLSLKNLLKLEKCLQCLQFVEISSNFLSLCNRTILQEEDASSIQSPSEIQKFINYQPNARQYIDDDIRQFQNQINQKCRSFEITLPDEFQNTLQLVFCTDLKEYLFLNGWFNDVELIKKINVLSPVENDRDRIERQIYESKVKPLLVGQVDSQKKRFINELFKQLIAE